MAEHQIRLRAAWVWRNSSDPVEMVRRLNLPTLWPASSGTPFRLIRQFGCPPIDPRTERVRLELRSVPGLISAHLNDRELVRADGGRIDWVVDLIEPLLARNELVLEVDLRTLEEAELGEPWGSIALVIVSPDAARSPAV
jgi:hypothetical protein